MYACAALVGLATGIARPCEDCDDLSQLELVKVVMACLRLEVRFRGHFQGPATMQGVPRRGPFKEATALGQVQ